MLTDILETTAAAVWLALGIVTWWRLRRLHRRMDAAMTSLEEEFASREKVQS